MTDAARPAPIPPSEPRPSPGSPAEDIAPERMTPVRQAVIGLTLAASIIAAWVALHVYAMWFYSWGAHSWITAPLLAAALTWLYVGLFIVAHDCMHGSLAPFRPALNRAVGRTVLFLYAGFDFDALNRKHHLHHRHSGTEGDPDFDAAPPHGFWHWYAKFMREYFSRRELLIVTAAVWTYIGLLGVPLASVLAFWALPALLSSLQLFTFGTYLPHVPGPDAFTDRHRARTSRLGWGLSLLTCFHFGYHHEHHASPATPWWRLPDVHALASRRSAG